MSYLRPRLTKIENLGVPRVVTISNPKGDAEDAPRHEAEVTYELMRFASREDFESYRKNESIRATFWKAPDQ